jgi:hypothetical protein
MKNIEPPERQAWGETIYPLALIDNKNWRLATDEVVLSKKA